MAQRRKFPLIRVIEWLNTKGIKTARGNDDEYTGLFNLGDDTANIDEQDLPSLAGNCINSENVYQ